MSKKLWLIAGILWLAAGSAYSEGPLPSWNEGPSKKAILDFIDQATKENSPSFIPMDQRIVVFDNDGTLWAEQPMYFHFMFAMDRVKEMAPQHPEWKYTEPYNYLLSGDIQSLLAGDLEKNLSAVIALHSGMTTEEYETAVRNWLRTARHPATGRPYTSMVYQPMIELLTYMRMRGFKTFIVSLSGIEFLRTFAEETFGVPREQVMGSADKLKFEMRNGEPVLLKTGDMHLVSHKEGKVLGIYMRIGRQPIAAFGNSDGDQQMLEWSTIKPQRAWSRGDKSPRLGVIIRHDDAKREWAYDRKSKIGQLDKALDAAKERGWTVVSMQNDWKTIYPPVPSGK